MGRFSFSELQLLRRWYGSDEVQEMLANENRTSAALCVSVFALIMPLRPGTNNDIAAFIMSKYLELWGDRDLPAETDPDFEARKATMGRKARRQAVKFAAEEPAAGVERRADLSEVSAYVCCLFKHALKLQTSSQRIRNWVKNQSPNRGRNITRVSLAAPPARERRTMRVTAFGLFSAKENKDNKPKKFKNEPIADYQKRVVTAWNELPAEEKAEYERQAEERKAEDQRAEGQRAEEQRAEAAGSEGEDGDQPHTNDEMDGDTGGVAEGKTLGEAALEEAARAALALAEYHRGQ